MSQTEICMQQKQAISHLAVPVIGFNHACIYKKMYLLTDNIRLTHTFCFLCSYLRNKAKQDIWRVCYSLTWERLGATVIVNRQRRGKWEGVCKECFMFQTSYSTLSVKILCIVNKSIVNWCFINGSTDSSPVLPDCCLCSTQNVSCGVWRAFFGGEGVFRGEDGLFCLKHKSGIRDFAMRWPSGQVLGLDRCSKRFCMNFRKREKEYSQMKSLHYAADDF